MVLSRSKFGSFFSVNFGWGIGVTLGCYWAGGVSGVYCVGDFALKQCLYTLGKSIRVALIYRSEVRHVQS